MSITAAAASGAAVLMFDRNAAPTSLPATAEVQSPSLTGDTKTGDTKAGATKLQGRLPVSDAEAALPAETAVERRPAATPEAPVAEPVSYSEDEQETAPEAAPSDAATWSTKVVTPPQPQVPHAADAGPRATPSPAAVAAAKGLHPDASLADRVAEIGPAARKRLAAKFEAAKVSWPPAEIALVAIKDDRMLELHARSATGEWQFVHRYPVLAASGTSGPKLKQGDNQVPEGVYAISLLNPNSKYHVSMRVDYPNAFDREMANKDGRMSLGGDIMIHGKNVSKGCIAVGDEAAEELFTLAADTGLPKVKVVIAPTDFRKSGIPAAEAGQPKWLPQLYTQVASALAPFKVPPSNGLLSLLGL